MLEVSTYFTEFLRQVRRGCLERLVCNGICGLVVKYIVAIDVTRVRFPPDAFGHCSITLLPSLKRVCLDVGRVAEPTRM